MRLFQEWFHQWSWLLLVGFAVTGWFYPLAGILALICMLAPVAVAFVQGRLWCGFFCPRGSFNDTILAKWSRKHPLPHAFTTARFRLAFLVMLLGAFTIQIVLAWGSPAGVGLVFWRMIVITTLLAILLGSFYHQRSWCRICPLGTLASLVAQRRSTRNKSKVRFYPDQCISCQLCNQSCPVAIPVHDFKATGEVTDGDCLKCRACIRKCPKKALYLAERFKSVQKPNPGDH